MRAEGRNASVELHEHHIVIGRWGFVSTLQDTSGVKAIPLSSITSVQFRKAGTFVDGFIRFSVAGETKPSQSKSDPNTVYFLKSEVSEALAFERIRDAVQNAINIPSLASLAMQHTRARAEQASSLDGPPSDNQLRRLNAPDGQTPRPDDLPEVNKAASDWEAIRPWEPKPFSQWLRDRSFTTKIVLAACIGMLILLFSTSDIQPAAEPQPTMEYVDENGHYLAAASVVARQEVQQITVDPRDAWVGKYEGTFDGANGILEIKKAPDQQLAVSIGMGGERCAGGIDAVVDQPGDDVVTVAKVPYEDGDYQESACQLRLQRKGADIVVNEEQVCMNHHGMGCGFDGSARRIR